MIPHKIIYNNREGANEMFEMKEEYKIGIKEIDEQHERLFQIAEKAYTLLTNGFIVDKYDGIVEILDELTEYAKLHFTYEEEYMQEIGHKMMFSQKIDHHDFIAMLEDINLDEIDDNQEDAIMNILIYLGDWLVKHIIEKDMLIGKDLN